MPDDRAKRVALNESRFRQINDKLRADLAKLPHEPDLIPFVCECGNPTCTAILELTVAQYEAIRADSRRFIVLAGHEIADLETVVAHEAGYAVVEKLAESGPLVDTTDPWRDQH